MTDDSKQLANKSEADASIARRPGRPKGLPKPPGSGRRKGTPNRATRDIKEAAGKYTAKALATLVGLLTDPDARVRATAARELLDRAHGKPMSPSELTGRDGAPLIPTDPVSDLELARLVTFQLAKATKDVTGEPVAPIRSAQEVAERERAATEEQARREAAQAEAVARSAADEEAGVRWIDGRNVVPGWREAGEHRPTPKVVTGRDKRNLQ